MRRTLTCYSGFPVCSPHSVCVRTQGFRLSLALLLLRCSLLRAFNASVRCGTGEATTLSRRSLGLRDQHIAITGPGTAPSTINRLSSRSMPRIRRLRTVICSCHVARHTLTREYTRRERRCADRALDLEHVTVRLRTAAEAMTANDARETAALRGPDDVDELLVAEDLDHDAIAGLDAACSSFRCLRDFEATSFTSLTGAHSTSQSGRSSPC